MQQNIEAVTFGYRNFFSQKFKNMPFYLKFVKAISIYSKRVRDKNPNLSNFFVGQMVDTLFSVGFYNGYTERKSEELAELILTPPQNHINKN